MSYSNCPCESTPTPPVDCGTETCQQAICRQDRYIAELFARTDRLLQLVTGSGIGPFKIAYSADQGLQGNDQSALAASMIAANPNMVLFNGDNNYPSGAQATLDNNWLALESFITKGIAYPSLGNHDVDTDPLGAPQTTKFSYLPNNKRYYHVYNEAASLDVFVLNSGINTAKTVTEPDGNTVNSVQYKWFINQLAASCGIWKIVMFHHPYVSGTSNALDSGRLVLEMDWGFKNMGIDLLLNGHTHTAQHLVTDGKFNILDVSSPIFLRAMSNSQTIYGNDATVTELKWAYAGPGLTGDRLYAEIDIVGGAMVVSVKRIDNANTVYSFAITK